MSSVPLPKSMIADSRAPAVFFEHVPAMGCTNGVYCLTLGAGRPIPLEDGRLMNELVGVGQLHGTRNALTELRHAIDRILNVSRPEGMGVSTQSTSYEPEEMGASRRQ
jgi:hypothetical protein